MKTRKHWATEIDRFMAKQFSSLADDHFALEDFTRADEFYSAALKYNGRGSRLEKEAG